MTKARYRAAIVGCGGMGRSHARALLQAPEFTLSAYVDLIAERASSYAAQFGSAPVYTSTEEMLERERPELVIISTAEDAHHQLTLACARSGVRAVICEKPLAMDLGQADEMLAECERVGTVLATGHQTRYAGQFQLARQLLEEGAIGETQRIHSVCDNGDLYNNGTHNIDILFYLLGETPVSWLIGQIDFPQRRVNRGHLVESGAAAYLTYANGVRGWLEVGRDGFSCSGKHHVWISGSEGEMEVNISREPFLRYRRDGGWVVPALQTSPDLRLALVTQLHEVLGAMGEGRQPLSSGRTGRAALEVMMAIYQSSRQRGTVHLPLPITTSPFFEMIEAGEI